MLRKSADYGKKMGFFWMVGLLFLLPVLLIMILPLRARIMAEEHGGILVKILLWRIPLFRVKLFCRWDTGGLPQLFLEKRNCHKKIFPVEKPRFSLPKWLKRGIKRAYLVERLHIHAVIGLQDAAQTAYAVGWGQTLPNLLPAFLNLSPGGMKIQIFPDFEKECRRFRLDCIIAASLADIIRKGIFQERRKKHASNRKHFKQHYERA